MTHIQGYDFTNADYLEAAVRAGFRDYKPSNQGDITAEDFGARLAALTRTIKSRLAESTGLVRVLLIVLLMDGIGRFVFWILSELKDAGGDVMRVEFSLMDINKQMNEHHTRALPNCKVLKGNINRYLTEVAPRRNNAVYDVVYLNYSKFSNDLKAPDVEMGPRVDAPTYLKNLGEEMGAAAQIQATVKTLTHLLATTESATPTLQTRRPLMTPQRAIPRAPSSGIVLRWPPCSNHASLRRASAARAAVHAVP
jgi:hypothetical protein